MQNNKKIICSKTKKKINRRIWVRPIFENDRRHLQGIGDHLIREMRLNTHNNHINFFRMTPDSFDELLSLVGPHLLRVDCRREPISPIIRLGITLRFLAAGDSMTSLSYAFRVGLNTVSECIAETTKVIWTVLRHKVLPVPNQEMWRNIATHFEDRWQFPNCTGAIDG
ncbi:hypothetical protein NQ315_016190 [Exocentrus adspersus]|uniref:Nuclease HARBI1 n=1 Tax=Exocentrus adspersus TaxID=1586481 RepID=A0AAV8VIW4_9CUCU|nr:hypothetical protein NQ315_016190 [Exocentrus adspersus]